MRSVDRNEAMRMIETRDNLAVLEVLPEEEYEEFHLPSARNIPLDESFMETVSEEVPDKSQPVLLYCKNDACEASPKAARMMDGAGYEHVYDYEAGKEDWKLAGLPVES